MDDENEHFAKDPHTTKSDGSSTDAVRSSCASEPHLWVAPDQETPSRPKPNVINRTSAGAEDTTAFSERLFRESPGSRLTNSPQRYNNDPSSHTNGTVRLIPSSSRGGGWRQLGEEELFQWAIDEKKGRSLLQTVRDNPQVCYDFFEKLLPKANDLALHPHGNEIIQLFIELCREEQNRRLVAKLSEIFPDLARSMFGCRVIDSMLKKLPPQQLNVFLKAAKPHFAELCMEKAGMANTVALAIVEYSHTTDMTLVAQALRGNMRRLALDPVGSKVLQKFIEKATPVQAAALYDELCTRGLIVNLSVTGFGNFIVLILLARGKPQHRKIILDEVREHFALLSMDKFGNHVVTRAFEMAEEHQRQELIAAAMGMPGDGTGQVPLRKMVHNLLGLTILKRMVQLARPPSKEPFFKHMREALIPVKHSPIVEAILSMLNSPQPLPPQPGLLPNPTPNVDTTPVASSPSQHQQGYVSGQRLQPGIQGVHTHAHGGAHGHGQGHGGMGGGGPMGGHAGMTYDGTTAQGMYASSNGGYHGGGGVGGGGGGSEMNAYAQSFSPSGGIGMLGHYPINNHRQFEYYEMMQQREYIAMLEQNLQMAQAMQDQDKRASKQAHERCAMLESQLQQLQAAQADTWTVIEEDFKWREAEYASLSSAEELSILLQRLLVRKNQIATWLTKINALCTQTRSRLDAMHAPETTTAHAEPPPPPYHQQQHEQQPETHTETLNTSTSTSHDKPTEKDKETIFLESGECAAEWRCLPCQCEVSDEALTEALADSGDECVPPAKHCPACGAAVVVVMPLVPMAPDTIDGEGDGRAGGGQEGPPAERAGAEE
ncbi:unnamed protein product [Vitrella brassicaformis CCMP3155]|uniref:PUM-HD domain-containing protein n=2 Tax=Vitrella brassicaformis TaxID=1169539 RepID=A0A0G4GCA0_VITBC|nr:unnamed protein product [Vitrella brassicaformis CCMP3155]|eukprot:CEM26928.1 unnamed protein product [Vitrella brassicaformis CCMP3155]